MPATVTFDTVELECHPVQAVVPGRRSDFDCFPYPNLQVSPGQSRLQARVAILENTHLRVTVCPDLGGRILGITHLPSGIAIVPMPQRIDLVATGPRGWSWSYGLQWLCGDAAGRPNSLGGVDVMPVEHETNEAGILCFELGLGEPWSWHASVMLGEGPEVRIGFSAMNRRLAGASFDCGIGLPPELSRTQWRMGQLAALDPDRSAGLLVDYGPGEFAAVDSSPEGVRLWRRGASFADWAPRQTDGFAAILRPLVGMRTLDAWEYGVGLEVTGRVAIHGLETMPEAKVIVQTDHGSVLELNGLSAETPVTTDFASLGGRPVAVVVRHEGEELLRWTDGSASFTEGLPVPLAAERAPAPSLELEAESDEALHLWRRDQGLRGGIATELARRAAEAGWWAEVSEWCDTALSTNAEDVLTWWLRAAAFRQRGQDAPGLEMAHGAGPLEPILRAEAYLSQPHSPSSDPNPLLEPLAQHPDAQLEVLHLLAEHGLWTDAGRWADECLRHRETPLMRLMLAWITLRRSPMRAEAFALARDAAAAGVQLPLPWRELERKAIRDLAEAFPELTALAAWLQLAD